MRQLIYSDYRRYRSTGQSSAIEVILFTQGLWASTVYRIARAIFLHVRIPVLRQLLRLLSKFAQKLVEIITGISLPVGCEIDEGLYIGHFGPVILHPKTRMGKNCNLSQGITIGIVQSGEREGVPTLGDRVFVGPNAIVIGGITVGEDAAIGAGAIVTRSVPPRAWCWQSGQAYIASREL
ncbi:MAG: serine acetyltransferase [Caldilineaceae bacterium]|nr:serine acetyltransferase [Caldilineaceae bacterium]